MSKYEVTFDVVEVPDDLADDLLDRFDCLIGTHHGGQDYVTITATGGDCVAEARAMTTQLQLLGLVVLRLRADLAPRTDIAERLGVTRQAVGNWVRGEGECGFPPAYTDVGGGIWLWAKIVRWAEAHGACD